MAGRRLRRRAPAGTPSHRPPPTGTRTAGDAARRRWTVGAALAVLATVGAVLGVRAADAPDTPHEVVQAYLDEGFEGDPQEVWDLTCQRDQEEQGPRERFVQETAAAQDMAASEDERMTVTLGPVRYDEEAGGHRVQLLFWSDDEVQLTDHVLVIEERGGPRVCTIPGMGF